MPIFPQVPRDTDVELFLNNDWVDVTNDVYARDGVTIRRGSSDESPTSRTEPSRCDLTLNNRSGNYSPRNPGSIYYGSIGRNTPIRVSIGKDKDTFTGNVSNGWGSSETLGAAWATISQGGTIVASDFNRTGGVGAHTITASSNVRITYLPTQYGDVDVTYTVSFSAGATITGGFVSFGAVLRLTDASNYILVFVYIDPDQKIYLDIYDQI